MSILIKGMEMPDNCGGCKFFAWKRGVGQHCAVDDRITFHATIDGMDVAYECNGNCPLVPVPVVCGEWVKTGQSFVNPNRFRNYCCSVCGYDIEKTKYNYCPNCGAKMDGGKDDDSNL